jgi:peroxiredoxin Q/BCP
VDYPFLSDPSRTVATAYGVVDPDQPFASRWTFYIGADGKLVFVDRKVSAGRAGEDMIAKLEELAGKGLVKRK